MYIAEIKSYISVIPQLVIITNSIFENPHVRTF